MKSICGSRTPSPASRTSRRQPRPSNASRPDCVCSSPFWTWTTGRQAFGTILNEDTAVFDALRDADGNEAARLWRVKIERCVRYMIAQLPEDDVAPHLWTTLAGRPGPGREELRGVAH
ncbi:hypothetical protein ABIE67_008883 [Streptomyces sp. V4I8]